MLVPCAMSGSKFPKIVKIQKIQISSILSHIQHIPTHTLINLYYSMSYSEEDDSDNNTEGPLVKDKEDEVSDQQSNDNDALLNRDKDSASVCIHVG